MPLQFYFVPQKVSIAISQMDNVFFLSLISHGMPMTFPSHDLGRYLIVKILKVVW